MEMYAFLIVGIILSVIGIINMTGNISSIHSYNRKKVKEEDVPKYGKAVGIGTLMIGVSFIVNFVLVLLDLLAVVPFVLIPAIVVGVAFILYAQFKYNKGIF